MHTNNFIYLSLFTLFFSSDSFGSGRFPSPPPADTESPIITTSSMALKTTALDLGAVSGSESQSEDDDFYVDVFGSITLSELLRQNIDAEVSLDIQTIAQEFLSEISTQEDLSVKDLLNMSIQEYEINLSCAPSDLNLDALQLFIKTLGSSNQLAVSEIMSLALGITMARSWEEALQ